MDKANHSAKKGANNTKVVGMYLSLSLYFYQYLYLNFFHTRSKIRDSGSEKSVKGSAGWGVVVAVAARWVGR